ncbi:MAG: AbrB/MazE/SpoVT family DNA-binding domain-containing protein [Betaproteobacteria bacterium]
MSTATLSSKGQITIPAAVRAAMGIDNGSRIEFIATENGQFLMIAAVSPAYKLKGMLRKPEAPVTIEQMNQMIASRGAATP